MTPYKLNLPLREEYIDPPDHNFTVFAVDNSVDKEKGIRNLTMVVHHPGIIWTSK